jgi:1,4-alpha-glucan branching enzyme
MRDKARDKKRSESSSFSEEDIYLFNEGRYFELYRKMGAHYTEGEANPGTRFSVWAPNAKSVSVIGDFNAWNKETHPLHPLQSSGIWTGFFSEPKKGSHYKYHIISKDNGYAVDKADPVAFQSEIAPKTGSIVWISDYEWNDQNWLKNRLETQKLNRPMSIYEVHFGSWKRISEEDRRPLTYREMAEDLPRYLKENHFTHVEFMPLMEHPFYGSWGYQGTGYFAATSRYGSPDDLKYLIDCLHQNEIGVLLDWVPSHFPSDEHGLGYFDGTHLYEHADPRKGFHPDWKSLIFNYDRKEVKSFLISNALFWLDKYHIDGLRVDAVASMLYLDYSRKETEWIPNIHGGRENLEAIEFLRQLNQIVYERFPSVHMIAEESTAWPMVSRPTYLGGLGFGMKWDMGWMHDTLHYFQKDPIHRKYHQNELTFRMIYAFNENFLLALSHDEVVHGKGSLLQRMPGDLWQRFANLRTLFAYMYAQPGKKLIFMGMEFAQWNEWSHTRSLDWHLLRESSHQGIQKLIRRLNELYRTENALHELDFSETGFEWVDTHDAERSVFSFLRKSADRKSIILTILNLTPVPQPNYRIGVTQKGIWDEILNTDAQEYGGTGQGNLGGAETNPIPSHGRPHSLTLMLPPLAVLYLKWKSNEDQ